MSFSLPHQLAERFLTVSPPQVGTVAESEQQPDRDGNLYRPPPPKVGEVAPVVVDSGGSPAVTTPSGPVNLNTATADDLDSLPGVGPSTAAAILAHREQHGPFTTVDELAEVRGIGPAKLEALRGLVTV